jgi:hypothetical protein
MSVEITNEDYSLEDPQSRINDNKYLTATYSPNGIINKDCIIDLHIEGENNNLIITSNDDSDTSGINVSFGNRFCKFYVI